MTRRSALLTLVLAAGAVAAPVPKALKAKRPTLDGTWEIAELMVGRQDCLAGNPKVVVIDGEKLTFYHRQPGGRLERWEPEVATSLERPEGTSQADAADYLRQPAGGEEVRLKGIVRVDGDEFALCYSNTGERRPTEVAVAEGVTIERYRRIQAR